MEHRLKYIMFYLKKNIQHLGQSVIISRYLATAFDSTPPIGTGLSQDKSDIYDPFNLLAMVKF